MLSQIYSIYNQFLAYFPSNLRVWVSFALAIILVIAIFKVIKKNFIFIILLIILLPASIPIFKNIWEGLVTLMKFLLTKG